MATFEGGFVNYYELFGILPDASSVEIRTIFMRLAKEQHPDTGGTLEQMQLLNKAYATLKNPLSRRAYDRLHSFHTGSTQVQYSAEDSGETNVASNMSDDEMDEFIDTLFAEYSAKAPKEPFHKKAVSAIRFRKKT